MPATPTLAIPYPAGADSADGPSALQAIAERIEEILLEGEVPGQVDVGDFKDSARTTSHDRWLLCDTDRELTQAEVEAELGLASGDGAALATLLGTGSSSIYGAAATGKLYIPGFREKVPVAQGPSHPKKGTGSSGGAESAALAEAQLPAHAHGDGTLGAANHSHDGTTLGTGASDHAHDLAGAYVPGSFPKIDDVTDTVLVQTNAGGVSVVRASAAVGNPAVAGGTDVRSHSHNVTGNVGANNADVTGTTSSVGSGTPVSLMQPYRVKGHVFIRA